MKKRSDYTGRKALRGRMLKMIVVMMLAFTMTVSGIAPSFSVFAEDSSGETVQTEQAEPAEAKAEEPAPAPEPEPAPAPEPAPEPVPVKEDPAPAAADDSATQNGETSDSGNDTSSSGGDAVSASGDAQADANKEEKKDEEKYPAQDFSASTADLDISVSASEGVFPEGTKMKSKAVSASVVIDAAQSLTGEDSRIVDAAAADITFWSEGKEIQPKKAVKVKLTAKRALKGESHEAVTVNDSGDATVMSGATSRTGSFNTDHFTVYGIIGEDYEDEDVEKYARHTYEFYVNGEKVDTQILRDGESIKLPADPAGDSKTLFEGWFTDEGQEIKDGDTISIAENASDATIRVDARFAGQYRITLYTDAGMTTVFQTILKENSERYDLPGHDEAVEKGLTEKDNEKFDGWVLAGDGSETLVTECAINGADLEYYAHFAASYTVHFDTVIEFDDFSVPDQKVFAGDELARAEEPDLTTLGFQYKDGYELEGWFTKDGTDTGDWGDMFDFAGTQITGDITLFARWEVKEVKITVELYLEAQNSKDYEYVASYDGITGKAGEEIPWKDILRRYPQSRTFDDTEWLRSKLNKGHWAGTGYMDNVLDGEESWLSDNTQPAIVVTDDTGDGLTASLSKGGTPAPVSGNAAYKVNPDGTTTVRIYYARDTYNLHFVFSEADQGVASAPQTMPEAWKAYAPAGYENVTLPTYLVKNGTHLGKRTHNYPDSLGDMFDAFLQGQKTVDGTAYGWWFQRVTAGTGGNFKAGQAVFDESNMTYDIRPGVADGADIYIRVEYIPGKTVYPYEIRYYDEFFSQEEILSGEADDHVISTESYEIAYTSTTHSHTWFVGANNDGGRLAAVTNYGAADGDASVRLLSDGGHKFTWKKDPETGKNETIVLHNVPAEYNIIFRQTANGKTPGGWNVKDPMDEITVGTFAVGAKIDIPSLMTGSWFDSEGLKKITDRERRVEYTATGEWALLDRNRDTEIPGSQPGATMVNGEFPTEMPAQDLIFYMQWEGGAYKVTIDWNCYDLPAGVDKITDHQVVNWNETIDKPNEIRRTGGDGWKLIGWEAYERDPDGTCGDKITGSFSFTTPVRQDYYLKAKWENEEIFTLLYREGAHGKLPGGDKVRDPEGNGRYAANALAPVKYMPTPDEGYVFIGWAVQGIGEELIKKDNEALFGSGDTIGYRPEYDKDGNGVIVMIAQYKKTERSTGLTYHSNYPGGADDQKTAEGLTVNGVFKVMSPDSAAIGFGKTWTAPDGTKYEFVCWTNTTGEQIFSNSSSREYFMVGEKAAAGIEGNDLYAVWKAVPEVKDDVVDPTDTDDKDVLGDFEDDRDVKAKKSETKPRALSKGVATGDEAMLILDIVIMLAAIIMAVLILIRRRKEQR